MGHLNAHVAFNLEPQEYVKIEEQARAEGRSMAAMLRVLVRLGYNRRMTESTLTNPSPIC